MILVTGSDGHLGKKIISLGNAIGTHHKGRGLKMDITSRKNVFSVIKKINPDYVVHCAALTNVDFCETNHELAWKINVEGTKNIADACFENNSKLVYISTDFVFDGKKGVYKESDRPNPINFYGATKLVGECIALGLNESLVLRTSMIYGAGTKKFVQFVIDSLGSGRKVYAPCDMFASPTLNTELAECIIKLTDNNCSGTYHTAGSERISRYNLAKNIAKVFSLDSSMIEKTIGFGIAKRPSDSSLSTKKVKSSIGFCFSGTTAGLKKMKAEVML